MKKFSGIKRIGLIFLLINILLVNIIFGVDINYYLKRAENYRKQKRINLAIGEYLRTIGRRGQGPGAGK